jgi:very-short-patch-repair endonuclease
LLHGNPRNLALIKLITYHTWNEVNFSTLSPLAGENYREGCSKMLARRKRDATAKEAKALRRRQTYPEQILWQAFRAKRFQSVKFRRQQPIGPYVVDFISFENNLIVELDGGQHNCQRQILNDEDRCLFVEKRGYKVIRFWNNDVINNLDGVLESIAENVK